MLTQSQLRQIMTRRPERVALFFPFLAQAMRDYGIQGQLREAAFIATIAHESGELRYVSEIWGPTPVQSRYEGRSDLGNTEPGDGSKFRGHGLIQTTGRHNHARARDRLRAHYGPDVPDFEQDPEKLTLPKWASLSAADFWAEHACNELADIPDFEAVTRRVNGGLNGWEQRLDYYNRALVILKPDFGNVESGVTSTAPEATS